MEKPKNLPLDPGVYLYKNSKGIVHYVGKAKNLKNRVTSYFVTSLTEKTAQMISESVDLSYIIVSSEFEALLLEAHLISKYKPKYNIALKDDKSPLYIGVTKDKYPRIITFRKKDMSNLDLKASFGPFLDGGGATRILRIIRRIIPFSQHLPSKRIFLYKQLGFCNPCPSEIENETDPIVQKKLRRKYVEQVRKVKLILSGKLETVKKQLVKEMKYYSDLENFEEAAIIARQIRAFDFITLPKTDPEEYLENPNLVTDIRELELKNLKEIIGKYIKVKKLDRIECFDIAHLSGTFPTASMVTFTKGIPDKNYYRHFKMYNKKRRSDVDSIAEVLERRLKHLEDWGKPDLIIVDGGKPQVSIASEILKEYKLPVIGLAKRFETIVIKVDNNFIEVRARGSALALLQKIRDEAHRFARRLHHKQVKKAIRES